MGKLFLDCTHMPSNRGSGYYAFGFAVNLITQYQFSPKWTNGRLIEGVQLFRDCVQRKDLYCCLHVSVVFREMKYQKHRREQLAKQYPPYFSATIFQGCRGTLIVTNEFLLYSYQNWDCRLYSDDFIKQEQYM
jgi:hypothetical protein